MKNKFFSLKGLMVVAAGAFMLGTTGCDTKEPPSLPMLSITYNGTESTGDVTPADVVLEGDIIPISIKSTRDWSVTVPATAAEWITVNPSNGKTGVRSVEIEVKANTGAKRGPVSVAFKTTGQESITRNVIITQSGEGGGGTGDAIYFEDAGTTVAKVNDYWPGVTEFTGYTRGGTVSQSAVVYAGNASVRNSGTLWDAPSGSTAPYFYLGANQTNGQPLNINGISLGGATNLTLSWIMQDTESTTAESPFTPTMRPVTANTVKLKVGYNGTEYAVVPYTVGTEIGNGWTNVSAEFKVEAGNEKIYVSLGEFVAATNQGLRLDNFSLTEGGNGTLIQPGGGDPPAGSITISEIRAMYTGTDVTITENKTLTATVISDASDNGGNSTSLRNIVIQDATGGLSVRLGANAAKGWVFGDEAEIAVKDLVVSAYGGAIQLLNAPEAAFTKTGNNTPPPAIAITAAQLVSGAYESRYVAVSDVQFTSEAVGQPAAGTSHTSSAMESRTGETFDVFVASFAKFKANTNPNGSGVMKGIAGINEGKYQIQPQTWADYSGLTGARFDGTITFKVGTANPATVAAAGGDATVSVTTGENVAWTATVTAGSGGTITGGATGTGNGTVTVNFPANTDTANGKSVTVTIATTDASVTGEKSYPVVFNQAAAAPPGGGTATFDFAVIGAWTTNTPLTGDAATFNVDGITATFARGTHTSNDPAGNQANGGEVRMYALGSNGGGNELTITAPSGKNISKIEFTYSQTGPDVIITAGSFPAPYSTWTGNDNSINFRVKPTGTTSQQLRITKFVITYN